MTEKIVSCSEVDDVCVRQQECYAEFLGQAENCPGVKLPDPLDIYDPPDEGGLRWVEQ